jgi:hypothetical protein
MIQLIAIAAVSSFLFGLTSGGWAVHRWYKVDALQAQVKFLRDDRARYKKSLQLGEDIDDEDTKARITNDEIERAILHRAAELAPVATPVDHVCVNGQWLLSVGELR